MSRRRAKRTKPSYPRLPLLAAVGLGLTAAACGPDLATNEQATLPTSDKNELVCCTDAGTTTPNDNEFFGGGAPFEMLPDGGVP